MAADPFGLFDVRLVHQLLAKRAIRGGLVCGCELTSQGHDIIACRQQTRQTLHESPAQTPAYSGGEQGDHD